MVLAVLLAGVVFGGVVGGYGLLTSSSTSTASRPRPETTPGPLLYEQVSQRMVEVGTAEFVFSGIGGGETVSGAGSMRFAADDAFDADVTLTMPQTGRVRAVLMPSESYLALPAAKGLPKSKPWVRVPADPTSTVGRELEAVVEQLRSSFDPAQSLGLLRAARRVEEVGPAVVEGESTTRYKATVDLRRATRATAGPAREQFQSMLDAGATTLRYDVWVDVSGLPRRYSADLPTAVGVYSVTGVYRDWGEKVDIERPTAKQVYDADKLKG